MHFHCEKSGSFVCLFQQDLITYSLLAFLYLFGTSLVASAIDYYQQLGDNVQQWTTEQLIVSVVSLFHDIRYTAFH